MSIDLCHFIQGTWASMDVVIRGRGVLEPIPCGYQRTAKLLGSQELYEDSQLCKGLSDLSPHVV